MGDDVKGKFPVPPAMHLLSDGWTPEWKSTENEWPRVEGKFLATIGSLFSDQADGVELFDLVFGETDRGKDGLNSSGCVIGITGS